MRIHYNFIRPASNRQPSSRRGGRHQPESREKVEGLSVMVQSMPKNPSNSRLVKGLGIRINRVVTLNEKACVKDQAEKLGRAQDLARD